MDYMSEEGRRQHTAAITKHGAYAGGKELAEHYVWRTMLARCNRPTDKNYLSYGGRGIQVCERWNEYENFIEDMGPRPSPEHSIDRIDNDANYQPDNCRWATRSVQQKNRRDTVRYAYNGKVQTISEWADEFGISRALATWRMKYKGGAIRPGVILLVVSP